MDVAALGLKIESGDVVTATANLDKFTASAERAAAAGSKLSGGGNTAKLAQDYARAAQAADQAGGAVAKATAAVQAANAHVVTYRNHLQGIVTASGQAATAQAALATQVTRTSMATQQSDAHVIAYRNNLERLAAANKSAGAAAAVAAPQVAAVGVAGRATGAIITGLAGILGGLVGVIIGSVVSALVEMAARLFENDEAMKAVTVASDNLGAAQSVLGQMFDLSTGKIKNNTAAIRDNIYMQAVASEAAAVKAKADAATALEESGVGRTTGMQRAWARVQGYAGGVFGGQAAEMGIARQDARGRQFQSLGEGLAQGGLSREEAGKMLERQRNSLSQKEFFALQDFLNRSYEQQTATTAARDLRAVLDGAELPSQYMKPDTSPGRKPRGSRGGGGKSEAEKIADLVRNAQAEITAEQNRAKAVEMSAQAAAELEQKTKLLNAAASAGLKLTPALTDQIEKLAAAYATAKVDADMAEVVKGTTDEIQKQRDAIADEIKLIGLRGDALARARREAEADKKLRDALPKGAIYVGGNLTGGLSDDIEARDRAARMSKNKQDAEDAAYAMDLERRAIGLTGAAAIEYAYISERLIEAKRAGIELSPAEVAAINAAGAAYAEQRYAIDQQAQAMADAREIARGFFSEWINGVREGQNIFKAFSDSVINSLNRIIDKLMDRAFESLFSGGGGGGFLSNLLGGVSSSLTGKVPRGMGGPGDWTMYANSAGGAKSSFKNANGNAFDSGIMRFANGGAFTNQIVTQPTLFRFAKGAQMGEMGEAGPEAIMPLARGPNGKLGVQAMGGGSRTINAPVNVQNDYHITGAVTPTDIIAMIRQGGQETAKEVKRQLGGWMQEYDRDGAVAS